mmetsp:Transcript_31211/g.50289  ORF Transcript_31211/g.50289 Transcript_31211/m.50289 type:complete len:99 (-) Transcript_31211:65-361(-)
MRRLLSVLIALQSLLEALLRQGGLDLASKMCPPPTRVQLQTHLYRIEEALDEKLSGVASVSLPSQASTRASRGALLWVVMCCQCVLPDIKYTILQLRK